MNNDVARLIGIAIAAIETIGGGAVNPDFLQEIGIDMGKYTEVYTEAYALASNDLEDVINDRVTLAIVATRLGVQKVSPN